MLLAVLIVCTSFRPAQALIVGTTSGYVPDTSQDPQSAIYNSYWGTYVNQQGQTVSKGPTGWSNVGKNGTLNGIYIRDSWVLTAYHTGANEFYTFNGSAIQPIPGTAYRIPNTAPGMAAGADLHLYRIAGIPAGMSPITISSQPPLINGQPGGEVVFVGNGLLRSATESRFNVDYVADPDKWTDVTNSPGPPPGDRRGYWYDGGGKSWGTNKIEDDLTIFGASEGSDGNYTYNVSYDGQPSTIAYMTRYDQSGTPYETQAVGGDSGGAVFFNRNQASCLPATNCAPQWELAGITINNFIFNGQSTSSFNPSNNLAVYGNATAFVDLSSYYNQIESYIAAHSNYSIMGDVNLDGVFSGDGTGPAVTDDVTAFLQGWNWQQAQANIESWKKGDLNLDGVTNFSDFLLLREKLITKGFSSVAASLSVELGGGVEGNSIPEPSAAMMLLASVLCFAIRSRYRRPPLM